MGHFALQHRPQQHTLSVTGEVDAASSPRFTEAGLDAMEQARGVLDLDLAAVTFLDSTGLAALLTLNDAAENWSGHLTIVDASRPVRHLLDIMKLADVFDLATRQQRHAG